MRAVICPDRRRADYEARAEFDKSGGMLRHDGQLTLPGGEVVWYMTYAQARNQLAGLRLTEVRCIPPHGLGRDYELVRDMARRCLMP